MNIIINRSDAIGDTLLTMPMAKFIKDHTPKANVIFIIAPRTQDLFINHPYVDETWTLDTKEGLRKNYKKLKSKFESFLADAYFYVGGDHLPSYLAWRLKIKLRGGLQSKWPSFIFLNQGIRQKRSLVSMHESDYNIHLLRPLKDKGMDNLRDWYDGHNTGQRDTYAPQVNFSEKELKTSLESFFEELEKNKKEISKPFIFIHPGMTGHTLNWPSKNYGRVILAIEKAYPTRYTFIVSHTPSDKPFLKEMENDLALKVGDELFPRLFFFDGAKKGLRHYMAVLKQACLFIGPSTGTTHIANALGVKQVGIYSPIKTQSSLRWGPFLKKKNVVRIIEPQVICHEQSRCKGESCSYYECMSKVEVDDVLAVVRELIETK